MRTSKNYPILSGINLYEWSGDILELSLNLLCLTSYIFSFFSHNFHVKASRLLIFLRSKKMFIVFPVGLLNYKKNTIFESGTILAQLFTRKHQSKQTSHKRPKGVVWNFWWSCKLDSWTFQKMWCKLLNTKTQNYNLPAFTIGYGFGHFVIYKFNSRVSGSADFNRREK